MPDPQLRQLERRWHESRLSEHGFEYANALERAGQDYAAVRITALGQLWQNDPVACG